MTPEEDEGAGSAPGQTWPRIDWAAPWLAEYCLWGQTAERAMRAGASVAQALNQLLPLQAALAGWRFVAQQELPEGQAYETFIHQQHCIPTRNNLHDFFNGLIWLHWPQLKRRLNQLQATAIATQAAQHPRGPLRDAITVLDENGGLLLAPATLIEALQARDWRRLLVQQRELWAQARLLPLGHALLEKLVQPRKPITAHLLCVPPQALQLPAQMKGQILGLASVSHLSQLDDWLASSALLQAESLAQKPFSPLPVLGVPGWWQENENFCFYDDSLVFRAPRTIKAAQHRVQPAKGLA